jgi:hypothetical protein
MARPAGYGYGSTEGQGPWGGRWSRDEGESGPGPRGPRYTPSGLPAPERGGTRRGAGSRGSAAAGRPRSEGGELVVDYDAGGGADDGGPGLVVGMKLAHSQFGVGEVRGWQGVGADLKVTLRFPQAGVKTILARFLKAP